MLELDTLVEIYMKMFENPFNIPEFNIDEIYMITANQILDDPFKEFKSEENKDFHLKALKEAFDRSKLESI